MEQLSKNGFAPQGPVVMVIMDGVGIGKYESGDAVKTAYTPNLDFLCENALYTTLRAHGTAVGLPSDDDMGNSEVGHNAIGCGRVFAQGAKLVTAAIDSGDMFKGATWINAIKNVNDNASTLHFIGLFSDGNVHSNIAHLRAMIETAAKENAKKIRIHILIDGRDVGETSALEYIDPFEGFLSEINGKFGVDARIASGGGRMYITMDRYNADWSMVQRGWDTHVHGKGRQFESAAEAVKTYREENKGMIDQDLLSFVIAEDGAPIGNIADNDSVIFFNFRGDRSIEITRAFEEENLSEIDRGTRPNVFYAGMMQYDGDLKIPKNYLVSPPAIDRTMSEFLVNAGVKQLAISETQKFGHVTYFFNGNRTDKFSETLEDYVEIPSDILPFEERPWMKSAEITDYVLEAIKSKKYDFIRMNFPNGDMVGHTGVYLATQIGVETVDLALGRILEAVKDANGILIISADHGNADDMFEHKKTGDVVVENGKNKVKTAHSLNPVPAIVLDCAESGKITLNDNIDGLGISSLAATTMELLGFTPPADYDKSIVKIT